MLNGLQKQFPADIIATHTDLGESAVTIKKRVVLELLSYLKNKSGSKFDMMVDLTAVDYLGRDRSHRFEVVYHLYSFLSNQRIRVKAVIPESDCNIDSVTPLWKSANWAEREVYDMYGINFINHPDLRRILLYKEFRGYPLRKDYPIAKRQPLNS